MKRLDGELDVRVDQVIRDQALMISLGIGWGGRRQVLGIEVAHQESGRNRKPVRTTLRRVCASGW
jgi:transposase-like protein